MKIIVFSLESPIQHKSYQKLIHLSPGGAPCFCGGGGGCRRGLKTLTISDQNCTDCNLISAKMQKSRPYFRPNLLQNRTLACGSNIHIADIRESPGIWVHLWCHIVSTWISNKTKSSETWNIPYDMKQWRNGYESTEIPE